MRFMIEVVVDSKDESGSRAETHRVYDSLSAFDNECVPTYRVIVGRDAVYGNVDIKLRPDEKPFAPTVVAAHEIGHVLAKAFDHPHHIAYECRRFNLGPEVLAVEETAWKFAAHTFESVKKQGLDSYRKECSIPFFQDLFQYKIKEVENDSKGE